MATAAELLARNGSSANDVLVIDNYLRTIQIPSSITCLGVENDDDVLRLNFKMPRCIGDIDLSTFTVRINYLNAKAESDVYIVDDLTIVGDSLTFTWLVGPTATKYKGNTKFNVCMRIVNVDGYVQKEYNTTIATLPVLEGLECEESVVEYYSDILEQWRRQLFGTGDTVEANLLAKSEEEQQKIASKGAEVLATIPEDYQTTYNLANESVRTKADAIVSTVQGENIRVDDSSNDLLRGLRVFGKTTQTTTIGAQLLNISDVTDKVDRGLTQSISGGVCRVVGTANATAAFNLTLAGLYMATAPFLTLSPGTYTATDCELYAFDGVVRTKYSGTFTIDSDIGITWVATRSYGATESVNETIYPMLNIGDIALPWEPYTGGFPSPSPYYPQEFGDNGIPGVAIRGKNLLAPKNNSNGGYVVTVNPDGSVTVTGAANTTNPIYLTISECSESNPLRCSKDKKYYAWGESSNGIYIGTKTLDSNGTPAWATISTWNKHIGTDFTNVVQVYLESNGHEIGDTRLCGTYRFQIEDGDKFTGFEGYKNGQYLEVREYLCGVPVNQNGNYTDSNGQQWICDEIDFERGVLIRRIGVKTFTGAEAWYSTAGNQITGNRGYFYTSTPELANYSAAICTHYVQDDDVAGSIDKPGRFYIHNGSLQIDRGVFDNVETWTAKLAEWNAADTPLTLHYILKEPVESELAQQTLVDFKTRHTNYPTTIITNAVGATMEVTYNCDTKTYVDNNIKTEPLILDANLSDYYGGHPEAGDEALEAIKTGRQILVKVPNASGDKYVANYSPVYMYQLPCNGQYLYLFYLRDEKQDLSALLGQPAGTVLMPTYGQFMMLLSHKYNSNPLET